MRCKMPRIDWLNLDYGRLGKHLAGAFLLAVGGAGAAGKPLWPAVSAWFWAALIYIGGAVQNYAKTDATEDKQNG